MSLKREPVKILELLLAHLLYRVEVSGVVDLEADSFLKVRPHGPPPVAAAAHVVVAKVVRDCVVYD